ncbi:MAG: type II secretion system F family protein [Chloroflexi bacterium]|nr:MAG: type II secretion system F family protein [Chloroflexota bacterium]
MEAVLALVLVLVGVFLFMIFRGSGSSQSIEDRLNEMAALGQPVSLEEIELSRPFTERVITPMLQGLSELAKNMTPQHSLEQAQHTLLMAGMAHKIQPAQFFLMRIGGAILGGALGILLISLYSDQTVSRRVLAILGGLALGYMSPQLWLSSKISKRQENALKALPDAMDLLTICVEAGLGFDAAMAKVAEKWDNELSKAFAKTVQEMQLGKLRREAMRNMAYSLDVPDLTSFVAAIIQADQLGVSIAKVMRIQSEQMRMKRRQRAEEKARKAPVKIMIPLVFFIFPTILIVLLGPAILQVKNSGVFGGL